ncbi:MAG: hypothetical protein K1Y02_04975 [Candidatus Hydrogenedentes bacterium]|nr:hypothetical protein [Candidatus Hydrogenedentota bacterium]
MKTWTEDATAHMERYLRQVRVLLEGGGADAHEVVEDLRNHILQQGEVSAQIAIATDEAKRILAQVGAPDEVAQLWTQMGVGSEGEGWSEANSSRPSGQPGSRKRWVILGVVAVGLLVLFPLTLILLWFGVRVASYRPPETQVAQDGYSEALYELPSGWFQAGSNRDGYETGTARGVAGIPGDAYFMRSKVANPPGFSTVMREMPADAYRGKWITLDGTIKTEMNPGKAQMWLRIDGPSNTTLGFDNMNNRPIDGRTDASPYAISLQVPQEAVRVAYGVLATGAGTTWFGPLALTATDGEQAATRRRMEDHAAEQVGILPSGWIQVGSNIPGYESGTARAVDGISGDAIFMRSKVANPEGFSTVMKEIPAGALRGKRVTLTGSIKTAMNPGKAQMWMRIDGADNAVLGFDNMDDRPIVGTKAAALCTISLDVPQEAVRISYGVLASGSGTTWFSPLELAAGAASQSEPASGTPSGLSRDAHWSNRASAKFARVQDVEAKP